MDYHSDVMQFEIKGQDELLSLVQELNDHIRRTNTLLEALAHEIKKDEGQHAETKTKPETPKNSQKYGKGKEALDKADIMRRYHKGESLTSIGRTYGCSTQAVWKIVHANL